MLFKPIDLASLVFFRVFFSILGFADLMGVWAYYHLHKGYFDPDKFQFKYFGFEWVRPLPEPFLSMVFIGLMVAALLIALGRWYRPATLVFAIGFTYVFLLEKALYLNHGYLYCWFSWILVFLPANRQWSGDVLRNPALRTDRVEAWCLGILPFMMGLVYFYGGLAKLNADWLLRASPLTIWLSNKSDMPLLGWLWEKEATAYAMAWCGALLDLSAPFLLLFRRTRVWAIGLLLVFHLTNTLLFQIGIFPWLSLVLSLLFFPPDFPRQAFAFLKRRIKKLERVENWWQRRMADAPDAPGDAAVPPAFHRPWVRAVLACFVAFHLLMPLRHWWFEGDVAWTEEGHRFSWRMMLRTKSGHGYFEVKNAQTGKTTRINPRDYLTDRQYEKLFTHPDLVLQFAHYLSGLWARRGEPAVEVYASVRASLNGRPSQPLINAEVDLAKETWDCFHKSTWVVDLVPEPTGK